MPTPTFFSLNQEKQQSIYNAALRVFTSTPYEKVSIQAIIKEADIPRGSFYQYFADKEDLYLYICHEVNKKTLTITYRDNMDYLWNMLYTEQKELNSSAPWYNYAVGQMKSVLNEDEFHFVMEHPLPPDHLLYASCAMDITVLYPLLLGHIQRDEIVDSNENAELLAFLFSSIDLLSYEYGTLIGDQTMGDYPLIHKILLKFYQAVQKKPSHSDDPFTRACSSIHLISSCGIDVIAVPVPGSTWNRTSGEDEEIQRLEMNVYPGSLKGHFPVSTENGDSNGNSDHYNKSESESERIVLEISDSELITCHLYTSAISQCLGSDITLIATESDNRKNVLIENGKIIPYHLPPVFSK